MNEFIVFLKFLATVVAAVATWFGWKKWKLFQMRQLNTDLGNNNPYSRMNAIRQLLQLARDDKSLRQDVMDSLCYYIRVTTSDPEYKVKYKEHPSAEIQEMLVLIFAEESNDVFDVCRINLSHSHLNGIAFANARLKNAFLAGTHLRGAILPDANLQGAYMTQIHLQGAIFHGANLQGANLEDAQMHGVFLLDAKLQAANLWRAQLQGTVLNNANMKGVQSSRHIVDWDFVTQIALGTDRPTDLSGIIFFGGVQQHHYEEMCSCLIDGTLLKEDFIQKLEHQVGQEASHELPPDSGAITEPPYTEEEADQMHEAFTLA